MFTVLLHIVMILYPATDSTDHKFADRYHEHHLFSVPFEKVWKAASYSILAKFKGRKSTWEDPHDPYVRPFIHFHPFPEENRKTTRTEIGFRFERSTDTTTEISITRWVQKGRRVWAWGVHNPIGLFEFRTLWDLDPPETQFTEDERRVIRSVIDAIEEILKGPAMLPLDQR